MSEWKIVKRKKRKKKKRFVLECRISESLKLKDNVMNAATMHTYIVNNLSLDAIARNIDEKTKVGKTFIITVDADCQYKITVLENNHYFTIVNQQYLHREYMYKNIHKFRHKEINQRKVIIQWIWKHIS